MASQNVVLKHGTQTLGSFVVLPTTTGYDSLFHAVLQAASRQYNQATKNEIAGLAKKLRLAVAKHAKRATPSLSVEAAEAYLQTVNGYRGRFEEFAIAAGANPADIEKLKVNTFIRMLTESNYLRAIRNGVVVQPTLQTFEDMILFFELSNERELASPARADDIGNQMNNNRYLRWMQGEDGVDYAGPTINDPENDLSRDMKLRVYNAASSSPLVYSNDQAFLQKYRTLPANTYYLLASGGMYRYKMESDDVGGSDVHGPDPMIKALEREQDPQFPLAPMDLLALMADINIGLVMHDEGAGTLQLTYSPAMSENKTFVMLYTNDGDFKTLAKKNGGGLQTTFSSDDEVVKTFMAMYANPNIGASLTLPIQQVARISRVEFLVSRPHADFPLDNTSVVQQAGAAKSGASGSGASGSGASGSGASGSGTRPRTPPRAVPPPPPPAVDESTLSLCERFRRRKAAGIRR
jgi:hypothetical protein